MPANRGKKTNKTQPDIDVKAVETLAGQGLTVVQIGHCVGRSKQTIYNHPDILDAIKRGRAKGIKKVANALFENAMDGNVTAQIFYLKNRSPDDWKDRKAVEYSGGIAVTHNDMTQADLALKLTAAGLDADEVIANLVSATTH